MHTKVIGFIPPIVGTEGDFNTFRLGMSYAKSLSPGQEVFLLNEKEKIVFGRAVVESIDVGALSEMCLTHGHKNHTELNRDADAAPESLMRTIVKIYGPHIATPTKKATVIYLRRIE